MRDNETLLWFLPVEPTAAEERVLARAATRRKLFVFLRHRQSELFDEAFQEELLEMYRQTGAGKPPVAPGLMAMITLLQTYHGVSDQEAIELTLDSRRWQVVLGRLGAEEVVCSQSALHDFRMRLIMTGMAGRLLERTAELARCYGEFSDRALRAAVDSSPLWGCGRVEDTVNLLAHAGRQVVECVARLGQQTVAEVMASMELSVLDAGSVKAALDVNWDDPEQKHQALERLCTDLDALRGWISEQLPEASQKPPLSEAIATLERLMEQDLEPDPEGGGRRIKEGVAKDRQISISDPEMRHGRKSASRRIDGYKRHVLRDLDVGVILSTAVTPANEAEYQALEPLIVQTELQARELRELHIDRGYLGSPLIVVLDQQGVEIVAKPWPGRGRAGRFGKTDFVCDLDQGVARCPAGVEVPIQLGRSVQFPAQQCDACPLRAQCTDAKAGQGRSLSIHPQEPLLQRLGQLPTQAEGRARLRERVAVEHSLAHVSQRQGNQARYHGVEKNQAHLQLVCAIQNLERAQALAQQHAQPQQKAA